MTSLDKKCERPSIAKCRAVIGPYERWTEVEKDYYQMKSKAYDLAMLAKFGVESGFGDDVELSRDFERECIEKYETEIWEKFPEIEEGKKRRALFKSLTSKDAPDEIVEAFIPIEERLIYITKTVPSERIKAAWKAYQDDAARGW